MSKVDAAFISNVIKEQRTLSLRLYQAEQAVKRVRELHYSYLDECIVCSNYIPNDIKQVIYPCPTIKALDGEQ